MDIEEIKSKGVEKDVQCAFCLNPNAGNPKTIQGKMTPDGKQAVAFLCDDHKDQEPKFAHQVSETGRVTTHNVEDLKDTHGKQVEEGQQLQEQVSVQKKESTDETAKKIASDVK